MQGLGDRFLSQPGQEVSHLVVQPLVCLLSRGVPQGVVCGHSMAHIGNFSQLPRVMVAQLDQVLARRARLQPPEEI